MANESDDTLDDRLESIRRRAENFRELLKDGDELTIAYEDGEVRVEESYRSKFERKHAKLFGRLLSMEAQMDAGWFPYFAAVMLIGVFLFGLPLKWWDGVFGAAVCEQLQSWWFYIGAPCALLYLSHLGCTRWEGYIYRRNRAELLELITDQNLDRDVLLVMLRDESDLGDVVRQLKLDTGPFPPLAA